MEPWLVAIGLLLALLVTSGAALRGRRMAARVRAVAGAAPDSDPVTAAATMRTQNDRLEDQLAADRHDHELLIEAFAQGVQVEAIARAAMEQGSATWEIGRTEADGRRLLVRARRSSSGGAWLVLEDVSELRRLQQIRTEFIDNLSHELRAPLTTVSLLAETLTRDADIAGASIPAKMRDRIGKIEVETGHLVQMVSELLDLSRIESGGTIQAVDLVDMGQIATESDGAPAPLRRPPGRGVAGRRRRQAAGGPRGRGAPRTGLRQSAPQRGEVQPRRRRTLGDRPDRRRPGGQRRRRSRSGHPAGSAGPDLRALLQGRSRAGPRRDRRDRPWPGDRSSHHRPARWHDLGRVGRGNRIDVRFALPIAESSI